MTRFEVWKRKVNKEKRKIEQSCSNLKAVGDYIRSYYPERYTKTR